MKGDAWVGPRGCCRVVQEGEDGVHGWDIGDGGEDGGGGDV